VVTVHDIRVEPLAGFDLALPSALPLTLANGARTTVAICATPDFTGIRSGNLVIESDDASAPLLRIPLTARRDSSGITASVTEIDFGTIAPCQAGVSQFVTVTNTGTLSEFLDTLRRAGPFF